MPEEMENAAVNGQDGEWYTFLLILMNLYVIMCEILANKVISTMKYQEITIPVPWGHISGKILRNLLLFIITNE